MFFYNWNFSIYNFACFFILNSTIRPYPERYFISQMNDDMIKAGQARNLIILVTFGISGIILEILTILLAFYTIFYFFSVLNLFSKKRFLYKTFDKIIYWTWRIIFCILYIVLSPIMIWYFWMVYMKIYNGKFEKFNWILRNNYISYNTKSRKISWVIILLLIPSLTITGIYINSIQLRTRKSNVDLSNIDKYLTLSNNNNNVMYFYFDRTQQFLLNILLKVDEIINKENSFINLFPEFTSYTNTISLSSTTNYSNPSIYGEYLFHPLFKNTDEINYVSGKRYNEMTQNEYYMYPLIQMTKMLKNNNISSVSWNNLPYYDEGYGDYGDMDKLQKDLKKQGVDIIAMDNQTLAYNAFGAKIKKYEDEKITEQIVLDRIDEEYKFKETDGGVFNSLFSQANHPRYNYKENGKYKTSLYDNTQVKSIWQSMESVKIFY